MFSTVNPSDVLELMVVLVGLFLLFKKVANMDTHHKVRVVALTVILSVIPVLFFLGVALKFGRSGLSNCVVEFEDSCVVGFNDDIGSH